MSQYSVISNGRVAVAEPKPQQFDRPDGPPRDSPPPLGGDGELQALCAQASELVGRLPGNLRRIAVRGTSHSVEIEWHEAAQPPVVTTLPESCEVSQPVVFPAAEAGSGLDADGAPAGAHMIVAPLVGTFYRAPEPGAVPFVEVGDEVTPGQTVGIVEAMKLMNPVVSESAGRIGAIYVGNGEPVEFGQNLVRVDAVDAVASAG